MPPLTYIHAIEADRQRDALIAQVSTMIEAMLKMTLMPQKQQAAQTLKTGWDIYKPTAKAALRERLRVGELAREWPSLVEKLKSRNCATFCSALT